MTSTVELYMYDLSEGWCRNLGPLCPVEAVWHTSLVAFGKEYVFGNDGIKFHSPGKPLKKIVLGELTMSPMDFKMYVKELKYTTWTSSSYHPFEHNCNHFTDHLAAYLRVQRVPQYVFDSIVKLRESPFYSKIVDWVTKNGQQDLTHKIQ